MAAGVVLVGWQIASAPNEPTDSGRDADARFPWEISPPPRSLVPLDEIRSGGPPPDGIPPIDRPKFVSVRSADEWIADREPVLSLVHKGQSRAYPLQIMTWHEIANDSIAGDPITVTFCPLCNSGIAFDRRVGDKVLDFGTSGRLYRSNLVMYDRQTKSLWIQFTGRAVAGPFIGEDLRKVPVQMVSWAEMKRSYPDARVLSRDTGNPRDYGSNPYAGYDEIGSSPFLFDGKADGRLAAMERVVAFRVGRAPKAYPYRTLEEHPVVHDVVGDRPVVVFYRKGTASALDRSAIADSRDVGATGVFVPEVDGRRLTFEPAGAGFRDTVTGSTWNLLGEAVAGPLSGRELEPVVHD
ncbi:MAG: DUF3179 domain-containing protein, partial [Candidatus Binatia bacterium]